MVSVVWVLVLRQLEGNKFQEPCRSSSVPVMELGFICVVLCGEYRVTD
jgi:hypothetical protein